MPFLQILLDESSNLSPVSVYRTAAYKIVRTSHAGCLGDMFDSTIMPTHMTLPEMKQFVVNHFEDFVNKRNASVIRENMSPEFLDHDGPGGKPTGVEGDEQMMLNMYQAMPDLRISIEDVMADGDKVVCRNIWRWTNPASHKQMQFQGFVLWRFEGGKIAERWATVTAPAETSSWTAGAR